MKNREIPVIRKILISWYMNHRRRLPWRETKNPYRIWVSEVMLQQTQVKTVIRYYPKFCRHFPDLKALAKADQQDVLKAWEGLGYYARARNLHRAAKLVIKRYKGKIPIERKAFLKLPGVGDYISAAVLSIAFDRPYPAVDGNVKRVLSRFNQIDAPVNRAASYGIFKKFLDRLIDTDHPGTLNQAMMELGALICKPKNPTCTSCPIETYCRAQKNGKVAAYPKRIPTRSIPEYHVAIGVVYKNSRVLITKRKPEGLLGGLWEFPGGKIQKNETPESACIREMKEEVSLSIEIDSYLTRVKHAYTHFRILVDVFLCRYVSGTVKLNQATDYRWVKIKEIDNYPFPKANLKFIPLLNRVEHIKNKKG